MPSPTQGTNLSLIEGLAAANTTFETAYGELYANQLPGAYQQYTKVIPGNLLQLDLRWTANHPVMRKWLGSRVEKFTRAYQQSFVLEKYEATLPVDRMLLRYSNNMGIVGDMISNFLKNNVVAYDAACESAFDGNAGASLTGFDGVALISASHPHGPNGGTQSNLSAGTNLTWQNFDALRRQMAALKFENGEPAYMRPTHMRVGTALETRAKEILGANVRVVAVDATGALDVTASAVSAVTLPNVWQGELTLIVDPRIPSSGTGAFYWELMDLSKPGVRPLVLYEGRKPEPQHLDQMDSIPRFYEDKYVYGLEGDFTVGAGMWMTIARATGTA